MKAIVKILVLISILALSCVSCTFAQAGGIIGGEDGRAVGMVMDSGAALGNSATRAIKRAIIDKRQKNTTVPTSTTKDINTNTNNIKKTNKN